LSRKQDSLPEIPCTWDGLGKEIASVPDAVSFLGTVFDFQIRK
jgi:hypothetical protein